LLHDFYLYHTLQGGVAPKALYAMAREVFVGTFAPQVAKKWMGVFYRRFFTQQFKRNCMPEGVNATGFSLNPRGDWRMPGDAAAALWLAEVEKL
jgi:NAD+ synthase (glutamine-hydrolysing)